MVTYRSKESRPARPQNCPECDCDASAWRAGGRGHSPGGKVPPNPYPMHWAAPRADHPLPSFRSARVSVPPDRERCACAPLSEFACPDKRYLVYSSQTTNPVVKEKHKWPLNWKTAK